jgi:hypothetical protein
MKMCVFRTILFVSIVIVVLEVCTRQLSSKKVFECILSISRGVGRTSEREMQEVVQEKGLWPRRRSKR